ncbi:sensor histidine kinase [Micromonospora echinofusca]|uniref:histidine kinase n=1 Tax=Micromonospora echinofusca TaxID=47858 RepID=A0ABS3VXI6_MICEH|nr:histidine kinase [Micromonospora echinofusca]MBO4209260.1 two-component sensor histidine kinase [Micromonospora echinofusca]
MSPRAVLAPLLRGSTWRRGVFLLLGGVILLPYLLLGSVFTQMLTDGLAPRSVVLGLLVVAVVIAAVPLFLGGSRALEIAAARNLLAVELPEPPAGHRLDRETRLRSALWIALHLLSGGLVGFGLISALPMALVFIAGWFGVGSGVLAGQRFGPLDGHDTGLLSVVGVLLLVGLGYAVAGLGALAASMAPVLLGPSPAERIAALEARAGRLAERNRLARELHDSVGHALTVATLQAGAARELLDRDPEFVRRALTAIEETGRRAMEELDQVLGLLRERDDTTGPAPAPRRTLADLDRLVADTRVAGLPVDVRVAGGVDRLPAVVSREGYRIVQEGLTNAARHGAGPVTVRLDVTGAGLEIDLTNPVPVARAASRSGDGRTGRGLAGMRERVLLLGGRLTAGPDDGHWRVRASLPVPRTGDRHAG